MKFALLKICFLLISIKICCVDLIKNGDNFKKNWKKSYNIDGTTEEITDIGMLTMILMVLCSLGKVVQFHGLNASFHGLQPVKFHGVYSFLKNMSIKYPKWAHVVVGGHTFEGRDILGLRINTPTNNTHKRVIFIESGIHANEWLAPAVSTYFINELLTSTDHVFKNLREQYDWHIFPTANPDGYHFTFHKDRFWRKTRSKPADGSDCYGADPNRNWDYHWGKLYNASRDPCNDRFIGTSAFSEVETRTLSQYISRLKNLTVYLDFHSDAQMLLIPYSDSTNHLENYDDLVQIGKVAIEYGYNYSGFRYKGPNTSADLLYKASGASMDWVRKTLNVPLLFCVELRGPESEVPADQVHFRGAEVTQMILGLIVEAKKLGYL